jgi:hypothetical protein
VDVLDALSEAADRVTVKPLALVAHEGLTGELEQYASVLVVSQKSPLLSKPAQAGRPGRTYLKHHTKAADISGMPAAQR